MFNAVSVARLYGLIVPAGTAFMVVAAVCSIAGIFAERDTKPRLFWVAGGCAAAGLLLILPQWLAA